MGPVDKSAEMPDAAIELNGSESVMSLLNELESMKTPENRPDELNVATDCPEDGRVAPVACKVDESNAAAEQRADTIITTDTPQTQLVLDQVEVVNITREPVVDVTVETIDHHVVSALVPCEEKEQIGINNVDELKDLSSDTMSLENVEQNIDEPITTSNSLDASEQTSEPLPLDTERVEGSIIHQTPDPDKKVELVELVTAVSQPAVIEEKLDVRESIESMDVQVETVIKALEPEVNCDNNVPEECPESTNVEDEKQTNNESTVNTIPAVDPTPIEMDVEPEKVENNDITQQETISVNEEIQAVESDTTLAKPQGLDENNLQTISE